ncbi:G2/M phase-specific E3 ubiquitin-protein ligase [Frankliniella fusca]|uniref:G2/M phase-specific E3 ubiquitin-protein ligase n=1 Tax=Frankliniella fusca TaxID=407009 RepID=A0AAE1GV82_9NEOP|nr:G2/M phase-specific E3 ubiquitin-protein ligase [Frankliniella fusca]
MSNGGAEIEQSSEYVKLSSSEMEKTNCVLCQSNMYDPLKYGEVYKINDLVCHYYCLLLSSSLVQSGADDEGLLGFFPKDIRAEVRRGSRLRCSYCRKTGATIGCALKSCKKKFHLPCGLKNGSMHQFFEQFQSFCSSHRLKQIVDPKILKAAAEEEDGLVCPICYESVSNEVSNDTLWAPCCKKRWFHRMCVERQAQAQGYFFKCPMCNNNDVFNKEMKNFGIYIPDADAAWEREPNAFRELLLRYSRCDSSNCKCPDGRTFSQNTGSWRMLRCNSCGSQGTHVVCAGFKISALNNSFCCPLCDEVLSKENKRTVSQNQSNHSSVEDVSHPSHIASSSSTLRRSSDSLCETQAPKRRKASTQSSDLGQRAEHNSANNDHIALPGPSRLPSIDDEDDIIIVDDSESDVEVVDVERVVNKPDMKSNSNNPVQQAPAGKTYPVPQYVHKDLFTKEGRKIKVVKVPACETVPVEEGSLGAVNTHLPEIKQETASTNSTASNPTTSYLLNRESVSISLLPATPKANAEHNSVIKQESSPANLGIKISNVCHSSELFSPCRTGNNSANNQYQILQGENMNVSSLPQQQPQQQQRIVWVPVSINGKIAAQAFLAPPGFPINQNGPTYQQLQLPPQLMPSPAQLQQLVNSQQQSTVQRQASQDVDVVTLD